jgi:hypothetical protein
LGWSELDSGVDLAIDIEAHEGAAFQFTCGELIGDCIVSFFEVSRGVWVKATQA